MILHKACKSFHLNPTAPDASPFSGPLQGAFLPRCKPISAPLQGAKKAPAKRRGHVMWMMKGG